MCIGQQEVCRTSDLFSCSPLRFYGGRNELNVQQTARALPYKRLVFVQSASVSQRAERTECAADGKSFAVQPVVFHAVRFGYAAGGTSFMCSRRQERCRASGELRADRFGFASGGTSLMCSRWRERCRASG